VGIREAHTVFLWRELTDRDHLEYLDKDGKVILKWIFKKWDGYGMDCIAVG
jgi:hypothetical protein